MFESCRAHQNFPIKLAFRSSSRGEVSHCETELETESGAKRPFSPFRGLESGTASVKLSSPERAGAISSSVGKPAFTHFLG